MDSPTASTPGVGRNGVPSCPSPSRRLRPAPRCRTSCWSKSRPSSSPCAKPTAPARKPPCAAWPPWSAACATTTTTAWCRWKAPRRDHGPGVGSSCARVTPGVPGGRAATFQTRPGDGFTRPRERLRIDGRPRPHMKSDTPGAPAARSPRCRSEAHIRPILVHRCPVMT